MPSLPPVLRQPTFSPRGSHQAQHHEVNDLPGTSFASDPVEDSSLLDSKSHTRAALHRLPQSDCTEGLSRCFDSPERPSPNRRANLALVLAHAASISLYLPRVGPSHDKKHDPQASAPPTPAPHADSISPSLPKVDSSVDIPVAIGQPARQRGLCPEHAARMA